MSWAESVRRGYRGWQQAVCLCGVIQGSVTVSCGVIQGSVTVSCGVIQGSVTVSCVL